MKHKTRRQKGLHKDLDMKMGPAEDKQHHTRPDTRLGEIENDARENPETIQERKERAADNGLIRAKKGR